MWGVVSCPWVLAHGDRVWVVAALVGVLVACGDDLAALAEGPPESTIWAAGEAFAGDLEFAEGVRVGARVVTPTRVEPGTAVSVRSPWTGLPDGVEAWVGLRAPRAAGRQEVAGQSRQLAAVGADPRDRWVRASDAGGSRGPGAGSGTAACRVAPCGASAAVLAKSVTPVRGWREVPRAAGLTPKCQGKANGWCET